MNIANSNYFGAAYRTPSAFAFSEGHVEQEPLDCDCGECMRCIQSRVDAEEDAFMSDVIHSIEQEEERQFQQELEGGDSDDWDEEDPHGSRPISEPDEVDEPDEPEQGTEGT